MKACNFQEAINLTKIALKACLPVLCHGAPGIGKSKGWAEQVAKEIGAKLFVFLPSHHDPVAIHGLPAPNVESGTTVTFITDFFAQFFADEYVSGKKKALILVDEIGQLSPAQQPPIFELIQNKKVAGRKLPDSVQIISATNTLKDGALTQRMATPLRNRFLHITLLPDRISWLKVMRKAHNQSLVGFVSGFLEFRPNYFHTLGEAVKNPEVYAFATNRSWEYLLDLIENAHENPSNISSTELQSLAQMTIGDPVASELAGFWMLREKLPSMKDIEEGKSVALPDDFKSDAALKYALSSSVANRISEVAEKGEESGIEKIDNLFGFAKKSLDKDMLIWIIREVSQDSRSSHLLFQEGNALSDFFDSEEVSELLY